MVKEELKEKAIRLSKTGLSLGKIAEKLGVGKTTVHTWIKSVPNAETTVPNTPDTDSNEITEYKEQLQNELGIDNDTKSIVMLKKAEMEYELQLEKLELERKKLEHRQKMDSELIKLEQITKQLDEMKLKMEQERQKSEQLNSTIKNLQRNNDVLSFRLNNFNTEKEKKELYSKLKADLSQQINNHLDLVGKEITIEDVDFALAEVEETIEQFINWIKTYNGKKSDYAELTTLKKIRNSLMEMINEFEETGEDELTFEFDADLEEELRGV